jgi:hypothetical protein
MRILDWGVDRRSTPLPGKVIFAPKGVCPHVHAPLDAHGDAARGKVPGLSVHGNDDEKA